MKKKVIINGTAESEQFYFVLNGTLKFYRCRRKLPDQVRYLDSYKKNLSMTAGDGNSDQKFGFSWSVRSRNEIRNIDTVNFCYI